MNHIYRSARLHAASSHPVYFYQFSYSGDRGVHEERGVQKAGAAHSDELAYLLSGTRLSGEERTVQMHLVKLWTNFVKYMSVLFYFLFISDRYINLNSTGGVYTTHLTVGVWLLVVKVIG